MADLTINNVEIKDVLSRCISGDRASHEMLYRHFSPKMFGLCLRYSDNYHNAEDILQEGFIKVFNKLDRFRGDGSFEGWMKRIFVNTAIEYYRKSLKHTHTIEPEDHISGGVNATVISKLAAEELINLIQKLPSGYRTIFNMYAIEGYSHNEIATMLNISDGTSKSQLARARKSLRNMIATQQ